MLCGLSLYQAMDMLVGEDGALMATLGEAGALDQLMLELRPVPRIVSGRVLNVGGASEEIQQ